MHISCHSSYIMLSDGKLYRSSLNITRNALQNKHLHAWHGYCIYHSAQPGIIGRCSMKTTSVKTATKPAESPKQEAAAPSSPAPAPKVRMIKVLKADAKFRSGSAREAWYLELKKYDGKPVKEYEDACTAKPPSLPKSLRPEAPSGYTAYFVRNGIMQVVEQA